MPKFKDDLEKVDNATVMVELDLKTQAAREFLRVSLANCLLMDRKQQDYGSRNIAKFGTYGCIIRLSDKLERLAHLYRGNRKPRAKNESIIDTLRDIANYANISLLCELGRWPQDDEPTETKDRKQVQPVDNRESPRKGVVESNLPE